MNNHRQQGTPRRATAIAGGFFAVLVLLALFLQPPAPLLFDELPAPDYSAGTQLPLDRLPVPDFAAITDVDLKKHTFFEFLTPFIASSNDRILRQRAELRAILDRVEAGEALEARDRSVIRALSQEYELELSDNPQAPAFLRRLLRRVDVIPPSLALAQAANESAWGTSRFARQGNNFFGQWCYEEGCGIVPRRRGSTATHEVRIFDSVADAVEAYIRNLNTFPSYLDLRLIRESLREQDEPIDGISLTYGLGSYSQRGEEYIEELQAMIRFNNLLERDPATIH